MGAPMAEVVMPNTSAEANRRGASPPRRGRPFESAACALPFPPTAVARLNRSATRRPG